ncbi:hypothetical protein EBZ37_02060, partial [bacterium]|nr:hypothetical protein [bacterium]
MASMRLSWLWIGCLLSLSGCYEKGEVFEKTQPITGSGNNSGGPSSYSNPVQPEQGTPQTGTIGGSLYVTDPKVSVLNLEKGRCLSPVVDFPLRFLVSDPNPATLQVPVYPTKVYLGTKEQFQKFEGTVRLNQKQILAERDVLTEFLVPASELAKIALSQKIHLMVEVQGYPPAVTTLLSEELCLDDQAPRLADVEVKTEVNVGADRILFFSGSVLEAQPGPVKVCASLLNTSLSNARPPASTDPCWISVERTTTTDPTSVNVPFYVGDSQRYFQRSVVIWTKDAAGNFSAALAKTDPGNEAPVFVHRLEAASARNFSLWTSGCAGTDLCPQIGFTSRWSGDDRRWARPGSFVVARDGRAWILDDSSENRGVLQIDLNSKVGSGFVIASGGMVPPQGSGTGLETLKLEQPLRLALDTRERLWIRDAHRLVLVDVNQKPAPVWEVISVGDAPISLEDDGEFRAYGTFVTAGSDTVVFQEASPLKDEVWTADQKKRPMRVLKIYRHDSEPTKRTLKSIRLHAPGVTDESAEDPLASRYPAGPLGVSVDSETGVISDIVGLFCEMPAEDSGMPRNCRDRTREFFRFDLNGAFAQKSTAIPPSSSRNLVVSMMHGRLYWWSTPSQEFATVRFPSFGDSNRGKVGEVFDQLTKSADND